MFSKILNICILCGTLLCIWGFFIIKSNNKDCRFDNNIITDNQNYYGIVIKN